MAPGGKMDEAKQRRGLLKGVRDLSAEHQSEDRSTQLFNCVSDPLFVYDRQTLSYLAVNAAAVAHYGYSREEFLGMTIKDIRPVDDVPALLDMLSRSGEGQEARGLWRHQKKNG